jgi:hypothetical protein
LALKDTKDTCDGEMTVPFVAVTMEGGCCANPDQPEGQLPMTAPMIAGQILHFKGRCGGGAEMIRGRHPPFVTLNLFQGLTFSQPQNWQFRRISGQTFAPCSFRYRHSPNQGAISE